MGTNKTTTKNFWNSHDFNLALNNTGVSLFGVFTDGLDGNQAISSAVKKKRSKTKL